MVFHVGGRRRRCCLRCVSSAFCASAKVADSDPGNQCGYDVLTGSGMMTRFIEVFRELGRATELLKTQVNLILVERLQQNWTKVSEIKKSSYPYKARLAFFRSEFRC